MLIFIRPENGNLPSSSCGYLFAAVFWDAIPTLRHGFARLAWFSHNVRVNMLRINESHTLCLPVANRRMCASSASFQRTNLFRILGSFTTWVTFPIYPALSVDGKCTIQSSIRQCRCGPLHCLPPPNPLLLPLLSPPLCF